MPHAPKKRPETLGLLEKGRFITKANRQMLDRFAERWRMSSYHAVLATNLMTESALADALSSVLKINRVFDLRHRQIDAEAAAKLGFRRSRFWECLPIINDFVDLPGVEVVLADPTDYARIDVLRQELGENLTLSVAERSDIVGAIDELYPLPLQLPSLFLELPRKD